MGGGGGCVGRVKSKGEDGVYSLSVRMQEM